MRRPTVLAALLAALLVSGCRQGRPHYPPACSNGPGAVEAALRKAPDGPVAIEGVPLSHCLIRSQEAGPITAFGGSVVFVAERLGDRAQKGDRQALVELGFLQGAVERGADPTVHEELKFRLAQELERVDTRSPEFRRGYAAGKERG